MEFGRNIHVIPKIRGANTYVVLGETRVGGRGHSTFIDTRRDSAEGHLRACPQHIQSASALEKLG